jgi:PIN domain nuclease of toxin-antitoxin system
VSAGCSGGRSANDGTAVGRSYVLDTHACVFMLTAPRKLGLAPRAAIGRVEAGRDQAWLPAAVVAEVLILRDLGRVRVGLPELKKATESAPSPRFLALDLSQLDHFSSLVSIRDPFDRLIVSAARAIGAALVTRDADIADSGLVDTVWS